MQKNKLAYINLHVIVFIWGFTAILGALISLDALPLVWYRMFFASIFIFAYIIYYKKKLKVNKIVLAQFFFAGLIIALHWLTFFKAIKVSNVSITLACLATGAFFTSILEPIFYKRKIIIYELILGLFVILGLYIIFNVQGNFIYGIVLALTSAFLSALFSVINGKLAQNYDPAIISFYEIVGGVLFLSLYLVVNQQINIYFFQISLSDLKWLLILSSICTAYAFIASVGVMKYLSPYTVMLTINLEPIYGIILALLIFNDTEKMDSNFYFGALIIVSTVILNGILKNKFKKIQI